MIFIYTAPFHPYVLPTIIISHNCILLTRSTGREKNSSRVCVSLYYFRFVNAIVESRHQIQSQCRTFRAWAESLCINHAIALAWESIHLCNISFTSLFRCVIARALTFSINFAYLKSAFFHTFFGGTFFDMSRWRFVNKRTIFQIFQLINTHSVDSMCISFFLFFQLNSIFIKIDVQKLVFPFEISYHFPKCCVRLCSRVSCEL